MDKMMRNVKAFHKAFNCHVEPAPAFPDVDDAGMGQIKDYTVELAIMARRLREDAAKANRRGERGLGLLLVRLQLQVEETGEVFEAIAQRDMVGALHELSDVDYVTTGTYHTLGLGRLRYKAHTIVHDSNMSKLGADGRPIISEAGRVVKGPWYQEPKAALRRLLYPSGRVQHREVDLEHVRLAEARREGHGQLLNPDRSRAPGEPER